MPYGEMRASRATRSAPSGLRAKFQSQVKASARAPELELAAINETNLSTPQSPTQTHPRLSGPHGNTRRAQCDQAPPCQGPQTVGSHDTPQAAGLTSPRRSRARSTFTAADRLHRRSEFLYIQRAGARSQTPHFVMYAVR